MIDPHDEARRLVALDGYGILDTPPEPGFDGIVLLACQICQAPVALVSLVAADRQWFKARAGFDGCETTLDVSICRHALARPGLLVIPDLTRDPRTRENALVTGDPFIRFYAGARLETPDGFALGTLCVIDTKVRPDGLGVAQAAALEVLAGQVMAQMELRRAMQARDAALRAERESDVRQRQILESAIDIAILATDRDGLVTDWNTGAERIFGWTFGEMRGEPTDRFFTPDDRAAGCPDHGMRRTLEAGRGNDERWHLRKDGSLFWANGEMMPLRNEAGQHIGFIKIVRDETLRREVVEKLRLNEEFLQGVLASSDDCIQVLDLGGKLIFMSEGGGRSMDVADFETLRGRQWPVACPDDLRPIADTALEAARAGRSGHYQGRTDTFAGTPKWWDVRVTPILDGEGRPEKLLAISRDITAARDAEAALREAEGLNSLILNSSGDCIVVLDLEGRTQFVSPGGIEAMQVSDVDAIIGLSWLRVWRGADNDAARNALAEARGGRKGQFQGFCPTHQGTPKWWDVVISPLLGPDGKPERLVSIGRDITASRQVAEKLAQSQERLNLALGASGMVGIWDWDLEAGIVYADANFARTYTVDPEWAARGAPLSEYVRNIHPDDLPAFEAELDRLFAGADEFLNEYRISQPDGSIRWVLARGRLVRDDHGKAVRFPGASVDITERKEAESRRLAVLELGDRLRDLTDPADMAFAAAEIMGRTLDASRAGYGTVSLAGEVITIERDWTLPGVASIAGTHSFRNYGTFVDELKGGSIVLVDDTERDDRTAGKTVTLDAIGVRSLVNLPVFEHGRFVAMFYLHDDAARSWGTEQIAFVRNVADRTRAAIERRLAEDRLRDLNADLERRVEERTRERDRVWRNSRDLLVVIDRKGVFRSVSPSAERILGWSPEEMLGLTVFDFVHPDELSSTGGSLDKSEGDELPVYLNRYRRRDGAYRWMSWVAAPEDDLIYAYGRDVTAEKEKTEALHLAEEQLRQAQKMEAVGQLTGGVAHDFNNLLTVIRSSVDLLKRPDLAEERRRRYVQAISDTTTRASKLTGQLLAFARRQALKPEVFDVVRSVGVIGDMVRTLTGSRIRIDTSLPELPCFVDADPSQFDTALVLLCHELISMVGDAVVAWQHGHRLSCLARATVSLRRMEAIELGICRSGLIGGDFGLSTMGNGRFRDVRGGARS